MEEEFFQSIPLIQPTWISNCWMVKRLQETKHTVTFYLST